VRTSWNIHRHLTFSVLMACSFLADNSFAKSPWGAYARKPVAWFGTQEAALIARNVLSYQSLPGSWPKNIDTTAHPYEGDPADLKGTFDNGATVGELEFLAKMLSTDNGTLCKAAFTKGLDHTLAAQYRTGGWPQFFPPGNGYHRHITFNDNTMIHLMIFLRQVAESTDYAFVDQVRRQQAKLAFDRGVQCILRCQIVVNGKRTAWCAQHDEKDYRPRPARSFELVSLSGSESVEIVRLLMSIDQPSPAIIEAVEGAVIWFDQAKLLGIRVVAQSDENSPSGSNKVVVNDDAAQPMWARFHEIDTNKPIFCDRDGIPRTSLAEISYERRNGYSWLGYWPERLLTEEYPAWAKKWVK
jgi:PelA/Pel-15E family pectate lyase